MKIKRAESKDSNQLTNLTLRSKNHWGYGTELMQQWKEELTVSSEFIDNNHVYSLEIEGNIAGFYGYYLKDPLTIKLEFLFIDPPFVGKGYGKILMDDFLDRVADTGAKRITLDADPNAENFYLRYGFRAIGKLPTSIKDRYLPVMELILKP